MARAGVADRRRWSRWALALGALAMATFALTGAAGAVDADDAAAGAAAEARDAEGGVVASRVEGTDRIDTAANVAERAFAPREETVTATVARADEFPDALVAASLTAVHDGPLLLTWPDRLPDRTARALDELRVDRVVVLGGHSAVDEEVTAALGAGRDVERLTGDDRWHTAAAVAAAVADRVGVGEVDGQATALLASGETFADALTAGPLAARGGHPVLLTGADAVPEATLAALDDLAIERAIVLGGTAAVSDEALEQLRARGVRVDRVAGGDRTATAAAFANRLIDRFGFAAHEASLARGDHFADVLGAGPRAGEEGIPLLLAADADTLGGPTSAWLDERCVDVERLEVIGGPAAVSAGTVDEAVAGAACAAREGTITYEIGTRGEVYADPGEFSEVVSATLNDDRGWSLDGDLAFTEVDRGGDLRVWLASPPRVEAAHEVCSARWSCRVGDDLWINDHNWRQSTGTYLEAGRSLTAYRQYVINHEAGHWLGHPDYTIDCDDRSDPAPVMNQQSIDLRGCATNVWPLEWERDEVRERWIE